jgi:uncharacterized protein (TIGR02145 family)
MKNSFLLITLIFFSFHLSSQTKSWDIEDLKVTKFRNGEELFFAQSDEDWEKASDDGIPAYCFYEGDESKGYLYNWFAVNDKKGLAPYGWQVPSKQDFENLIKTSKEINSKQGDSRFILDLKYNGYRTFDGFAFYELGVVNHLWTSTIDKDVSMESYAFELVKDQQSPKLKNERRENGYSVRCIRNFDEEIMLPPNEIVAKSPICFGEQITLRTSGGELDENSKWVWYKNDIFIGEGESIQVKPSSTSVYSVRSQSSKGKFSEFIKKEIEVNSRPSKPTSISVSSNELVNQNATMVCEGSTVTFTVNGELTPGSKWNWTESGRTISTQSRFSKKIDYSTTIYVTAENTICGNSEPLAQVISVLKKSVLPNTIQEKYLSFNRTKLYFETGSLGGDSQWKWYRRKINGELKYLNSGKELTINSFKTRKYVLKVENGICDNQSSMIEHSFLKNSRYLSDADWEKNYSNSLGVFHYGFELGLDCHNLSDSIHVLDSIFNFRAKSYGLNVGLSFHPIITEFFTLGTRTNFIIDFGKVNNTDQFQQLFPTSTGTKTPSFLLSKSSVGGEMLISVLSNNKLKLLIDYDLANYRTVKNFRDSSFTSYRIVKKETTSIGFRIGSYSNENDINSVQLDVLYSLSNFNETPLFDFSQSMYNHSTNLRSGFKLRLWVHNVIKLEAGIIYSLNPVTLKNDFNSKNAIVNFGLVWSFDRFY